MDEDRDIGGVPFNMNKIEEPGNQYYILIDNLEKDLSPRSIVEFIHRQTSVTAEAYVFPSLLAESYARGAIVLDSKRSLEEIYEFLINPDHAIISSTGRYVSKFCVYTSNFTRMYIICFGHKPMCISFSLMH